MIELHLREYAEELDELNYRVRLRASRDDAANSTFDDGAYFSTSWFRDVWRNVFESQFRHANLEPHSETRVLDVCCGQGFLGEWIADRYGAQVTFCDLSSRQLDRLRARIGAGRASMARSRVTEANIMNLPFSNGSFDLVVGNSFLHHISDVPAALAELRRVQAGGGRTLLLHEPGILAPFWGSFPWSLVKNTMRTQGGGFTDLWRFETADLVRLCQEAGYGRVAVSSTGILSAILVNWYLLLALKGNWRARFPVSSAYHLRSRLNALDRQFVCSAKDRVAPSLMVDAR